MDAFTPQLPLPRRDLAFLASGLTETLRAKGLLDPWAACLCRAAALLISTTLRFDAADPAWPDRDRVVMSPALRPLAEAITALMGAGSGFLSILPDPPGQSLGAALGMAMAERTLAARFGRSLVDHRTWVLATPADLSTGLAQEAAAAAGAQRLGRLTVIAAMPDAAQCPLAFAASWTLREVAADDDASLQGAFSSALRSHKPTLVTCAPARSATPAPAQEHETAAWAAAGSRGAAARRSWLRRLARHPSRDEFERTTAGRMPPRWHTVLSEPGPLVEEGQPLIAPLTTARLALVRLASLLPELVTLSNDSADTAASLHIHNHARACALGGMAMHGGTVPVGQTRLADTEGLGPALRTASQAGLRVIHIVSEPAKPCPTAGHRAGLRAMRNVFVFRPADASETLECAELALRRVHGPSILMLSEVACAPLMDRPTRTRCVHGGFLVREPQGRRDVTVIASGIELVTALAAHDVLEQAGVMAAVVSLPCWELFANQEPAWREQVLGAGLRIGIESGSGFGWERWLGSRGVFIGSEDDDGACDITVERIVAAARSRQ